MKKIKLAMLAVAFLLTGSAIYAYKTADVTKEASVYYFELQSGGDKTVRTDWISASNNPNCAATHSDEPCRLILPTSGTNPSVADFNTVLSNSNDFQQEDEMVTYKP